MQMNEITHEDIFNILIILVRISGKFHELEKTSFDIGNGEKLYPSEIHVIVAVGDNQGNNVTELSKRFGITKGAVSQVVNKLFVKGFLSKERNEKYGKEIILSLTEKGQLAYEIQDNFHNKMGVKFIKYLEPFTPEQINIFLEILGNIEEYIDTFLSSEL